MRFLALLLLLVPQDPEAQSRKMFEQAEALQKQDKFADAQQLFRAISQKYPETQAGKEAAQRGADNAFLKFVSVVENGPRANRVDIVLTGDGYTLDKQQILVSFANDVVQCFKTGCPTTKEYFSYFNFHRMHASSKESGVTTKEKKFDTVFGGNTLVGRLDIDPPRVSRMMDLCFPEHDTYAIVSIFSGSGHSTGGGSMACIAGTGAGPVIHEWGHTFPGLMDEYENNASTNGANVSSTSDPNQVPWAHWLREEKYAEACGIGVFLKNAGGAQKWIPTKGRCCMDTGGGDFCAVCREVFLLTLYQHVSPIDEATPAGRVSFKIREKKDISVIPLKPLSHELTVKWTLRRLEKPPKRKPDETSGPGDTTTEKPVARTSKTRPVPTSAETIELDSGDIKGKRRMDKSGRAVEFMPLEGLGLKPGWYRLTVSVKDEPFTLAKLKSGEVIRVPWVLRDPQRFLEERLQWLIEVSE